MRLIDALRQWIVTALLFWPIGLIGSAEMGRMSIRALLPALLAWLFACCGFWLLLLFCRRWRRYILFAAKERRLQAGTHKRLRDNPYNHCNKKIPQKSRIVNEGSR